MIIPKTVMESGLVRRYHTVDTLGYQTNAEHQWGVAVILMRLILSPSAELLKAALTHDCGELATGDIPAHFKWRMNPEVRDGIEYEEEKTRKAMGLEDDLSETEKTQLKAADMLELMSFCLRQLALGNRNFLVIYNRGHNWFVDHPDHLAFAAPILSELNKEITNYV